MKEMTLTVEHATRRIVTQAILSDVSADEPDLGVCIRQVLGEEFGNLANHDLGGEITVDWENRPDGVLIEVRSDSQREHFSELSNILNETKQSIKNGEDYPEFFERFHGIGHRMMVSLSSNCDYTSDGRLIIWFDRNDLPDFNNLHVVI